MNSGTFDLQSVNVGDCLPELAIDVSTSLIIATAIATRDYQNVHHDRDQAVALGSKDIFMNILTTNGLVGRFVTDWIGPAAELREVNIRLGVPNYAGDSMLLSGSVTDKREEEGDWLLGIEVVGSNSLGQHVTAQVTVAVCQDPGLSMS